MTHQNSINFRRESETKNKIRFKELGKNGKDADSKDAVIGMLYVTKKACKAMGDPEAITVHLEIADSKE